MSFKAEGRCPGASQQLARLPDPGMASSSRCDLTGAVGNHGEGSAWSGQRRRYEPPGKGTRIMDGAVMEQGSGPLARAIPLRRQAEGRSIGKGRHNWSQSG